MALVAVVGAGFSGAVIARELALAGHSVEIFDTRDHVAGNCHTQRDPETGVMLHVYGPHIFHTSNDKVWDYVRQFDDFVPFTNRVKAVAQGRVYSLPVNLSTINQLFGRSFSPSEAIAFLEQQSERPLGEPASFEDQALTFLGRELYELLFKGYTLKQWGVHPQQLPASILKRLPVRFSYDDNYYSSAFQGIPRHGYTFLIERILDQPGIDLHLATPFTRDMASEFDHVFYSGPLDAWFGHCKGRLGYRTLDFHLERHSGDYQGNAVINYPDEAVPYTRISEHKHFAPWEHHERTVIYKEYSRPCDNDDIPYYPIRLVEEMDLFDTYAGLAEREASVTFVGRLGTYRYLDMHVTIAEALDAARLYERTLHSGTPMPAFAAKVR